METPGHHPDTAILHRAIVQSPSLVVVTDDSARITWVNPRFSEVTGYTRDEVIGQNPRILQSGRTPPEVYEALWEALEAGGAWRGEFENRRKDGERYWVEAVISAVRDDDGRTTHYLALQQDISARRAAEEALARLRANLELRVEARTAELEAARAELERFSHTLAHDLKRSLRTVTSFAQVVVDDYASELDEDGVDLLSRIRAAAARTYDVVSGLEVLAHVTRAELQPDRVRVAPLVSGLVDDLATAEPGRVVTVEVDPELAVWGDARLVQLALGNLLENAWKFTATCASAHVEVGCDQPGLLFVRDNGPGFGDDDGGGLFEWYARGADARPVAGTGVGLAIVQRVAARHGGSARAARASDGGAVFYLEFPEPE